MNKTNIEWCDYTLNPVVGCKFGCQYCYAKKLNDRFEFVKKWTEPEFFPERLKEPAKLKKPATIFIGSMCDLFGPWINMDWVYQTIEMCEQNPQHKFMFLTKNFVGYKGFTFPDNCMIGITMTTGSNMGIEEFFYYSYGQRFISIEPLLGSFKGVNLSIAELVIVGAMTGKNPAIPKKEWIESIEHPNIFYKSNIKKYL